MHQTLHVIKDVMQIFAAVYVVLKMEVLCPLRVFNFGSFSYTHYAIL